MKTIKKILDSLLGVTCVIVIPGLFVLGLTGRLDGVFESISTNNESLSGNDTNGGFSDNTHISVNGQEPSADTGKEEVSSQKQDQLKSSSKYFYVGDTISFASGLTVDVVDAGKEFDINANETYAYVELDINNQSNDDISAAAYYCNFYGDDYSLQKVYKEKATLYTTTIAKGRKGHGRIYAECPNYDSLTNIEMEFGDAIIIIKDRNESSSEETSEQSLVYGTYVYDDGSSNICTAQVYLSMGDDDGNYAGDALHIEIMGYGGHGVIDFDGMLEQRTDGTYVAHGIDYSADVICTFDSQGLSISVAHSLHSTLFYAEGYYNLESVLNIDEVN